MTMVRKNWLFLLICMFCCTTGLLAQVPSDLSSVKASQIKDAQLMQMIKQAESSGLTEAEMMQELKRRGMPESEIEALSNRVKLLMPGNSSTQTGSSSNNSSTTTTSGQYKRSYKGDLKKISDTDSIEEKSRVFGAELFKGVNPLFVPNLKLATPLNYIVGPEDELQLDIYGNNISSQKLTVTPEGNVNIKYAGLLNLSGLTIEQSTELIRSRLLMFYPSLASGETKISLTLSSVRSIQVMVVGAVKKPGTITLPSVATLFNALYASGGPVDNGSFRNIELIRDNKIIAKADLYNFIMKGDTKANLMLRDNDVILVPFATSQIILDGALNRVGIFEVREGETLKDALYFVGGFKGNAYRGRMTGTRVAEIEKRIIDVASNQYGAFVLAHGDSLSASEVIDKFQNRVQIAGAVFKPGVYALEDGMDVKKLISKAYGLKEDAFKGRVNMVRWREDKSKEYLSFSLTEIMSGSQSIPLIKEDSLYVSSSENLRDSSTVVLNGAVRKPGKYRYEDGISLSALILQAGGYTEDAFPSEIEIGRRNLNADPTKKGASTSNILKTSLDKNLGSKEGDIILQPYDIVTVKTDPSKISQISIKVSGEVKFAGTYTLSNPEERLSSIILRAGGLLPYADINGARLIRQKKTTIDTAELNIDFENLFVKDEMKKKNDKDTSRNKLFSDKEEKTTEVALNLRKALSKPGGNQDLVLQEGDELIVPRRLNTVAIKGEVLSPVSVQYSNRRLRHYVSAAGGFTKSASRGKAFVVYPNGSAAQTHGFLGIRKYPKVLPGSEIFVPGKISKGFDPAKAGIIVSALSVILTALILLNR